VAKRAVIVRGVAEMRRAGRRGDGIARTVEPRAGAIGAAVRRRNNFMRKAGRNRGRSEASIAS